VSLLVIDEQNKEVITSQQLADFGIDERYIGERESILLIELLLEYALD
jgi:hypothetical protein